MPESRALFPALLKYWRGRRGLSQLDFALRAGVSAKHVSFLETGRSAPSEEMVMLLAGTLALTPRQRDELLTAAGFEAARAESRDAMADPAIRRLIERMLAQQEPYPMLVMNGAYDVLAINGACRRLLAATLGDVPDVFNAARIIFDPEGVRPFVEDWERAAATFVDRLHREALLDPTDGRLAALIEDVMAYPGVDPSWRTPDFSRPAPALLPIGFTMGGMTLRFLATVTRLSAPQSAALDDLQMEAWFALDETTEAVCQAAAAGTS